MKAHPEVTNRPHGIGAGSAQTFTRAARTRFRLSFAACFLALLAKSVEAAKPFDLKKFLEPTGLQRFDGEVKAVDTSARTVTIGMPMRFTFHANAKTKITQHGAPIPFDRIKVGDGIDVVGRHGASDKWTAVSISLEKGATYLYSDEISARTMQGKPITGLAVIPLITYQPPAVRVSSLVDARLRAGLFLLAIKPDGTVSNVKPVKPFGVSELDGRTESWLKKWKFRANSVTEVRVPVNFEPARGY